MLQRASQVASILSGNDPAPVEAVNLACASPFLLTCEHAGRTVPSSLGDLGVDASAFDRHIAYDIGADGLARAMASRLEAPLILQRYSRLVVDCNRPFDAPDCMPEISDGTVVPSNIELSDAERRARYREIHEPFHHAVSAFLDQRRQSRTPAILVSVHSFTPRLAGKDRQWLVGALFNRDRTFADLFLANFAATSPGIVAALNEPYVVDDMSDYTIPVHGEARGIPHVLLEIRNDQIATPQGQEKWADLLSDALVRAAATMHEKGNAIVT